LNFFLFLLAIAPPSQEQKSAPERERGERSLVFHPAGLAKGKKKKKKREEEEEAQQHTHKNIWRLWWLGKRTGPDRTESENKLNFYFFPFLFFIFYFYFYFLFFILFFFGRLYTIVIRQLGKDHQDFFLWVVGVFFFFYPFNLLRGEYQVFTTDSCLMAVSFFSRVLMMIIIIIFFFVMSCVCVFYP
jgi:hypothetical protein